MFGMRHFNVVPVLDRDYFAEDTGRSFSQKQGIRV